MMKPNKILYILQIMEPSARQLERQKFKQFIAAKKNNMKVQKTQQTDMTQLFSLLNTNDIKGFRQNIISKESTFVLSFLTKSDDLLQSTLQKMIKSQFKNQYFKILNQWSRKNTQILQEKFMGIEKEDWKSRFQMFNHDLYKQIIADLDEGKNTLPELIQNLSEQGTFFGILYKEYWNLIFIKQTNPREQKVYLLLNQFIVPLAQELQKKQQGYKGKPEVLKYKNMLQLEQAWQTDDFKKHLANPDILVLKQFNYNFMHELFAKKKYDQAMSLYEYILQLAEKNEDYNDLAEKCLNSFNSSDETPLDICLSCGTYQEIIKLLAFIKKYDEICLSTHCLTKLLSNKNLTKEKQKLIHLICECIDGNIANRGYVERTYQEQIKSYKSKYNSKQITIKNIFKRYGQRFIIIFDRNLPLLDKNGSNSFPLLTFLTKYGDNADLKILELLFPELLTRKIMKIKIFSLLKMYGTQTKPVKEFSEASKDIKDIIYYQQSILSYLPSIKNKEILQYFFTKMFINQFYVFEFKDVLKDITYVSMTEHHFLFEYCIRALDLSENSINKLLLQKIMQCKQNEKKFQNYDLYVGLLKNMAEKRWIKFTDSQEWLPRQVKAYVRTYLDKYPAQQLLGLSISKPMSFDAVRKGDLQRLVRVNTYLHILFTDEQLVKKFSSYLPKYEHFKAKEYNINTILKIYNDGDKEEENDVAEQLQGCDQFIKKIRMQKNIQEIITKFRTLADIEDPELQEYKLGQTLEECSQVQNYKITIPVYDEKLQQKLILAIQNGINPRISCVSVNKPPPKFANNLYKKIFERMAVKSVDFIDIFIRCQNELEEIFTMILQKIRKNFVYRILHRGLKVVSFDEKNGSYNRIVSFILMTKIIERLKISYKGNQYLKRKMTLKFLQEVQSMIYNITWEENPQKVKILNQQLDIYICKWHPYVCHSIHCAQLPQSMQTIPYFLQQVSRSPKLTQIQKKTEDSFGYIGNYYGRLFLLIIHTNKKKLHLPKFFTSLNKQEIFIYPWWEIFVMKLEHTSISQKKNVIRECLPFFQKQNPKTVLNLPEALFHQINKLPLKEYMEVIQMIADENLIMQLLQKNLDQEKNVEFMLYALKKYKGFKRVIIDKMTENPQQIKVIALCILLRPFDMEIQSIFMQQKGEESPSRYDSITIWFKSTDQTFQIFLQVLNKIFERITIPQENNIQLLKKVLKALFYSQMWNRLIKLMQTIQLYSLPMAIQTCYLLRGNIQLINKIKKEDKQLSQLIKFLFKKLQNSLWNEQLFTCLYVVDYQSAFKTFKTYEQIKQQNAKFCLKTNPKGATLWRKSKLSIVGDMFKVLCYTAHQLDQKPWIIDLLIINIQSLSQKKAHQRILKTLFLHEKLIPYYKQLKIVEDYPFYAEHVLSANGLKTLKKLPQQMRSLVHKHIKKIPNLHPQLIKQLIDDGLITTDEHYILNILYTNNIDVIQHYCKKYQQINFSNSDFIASLNQLKPIGKRGLIGFLLNFRSQQFVLSFLKKFNILKSYPQDFYTETSRKILSYICIRKHTKILQYYLDYCKNTLNMQNITFVSGQEGKLTQQGVMTLPMQIAVDSDFYQYYFLVKSSGGDIPIEFQYSSRFLFEQNLKQFQYIPELKRRIDIINSLTTVLRNGRDLVNYKIYFQSIFCTTKDSDAENKGGLKIHEKQSLDNLLHFICEGTFIQFSKLGSYERLGFLLINQDIVPKSILKEHYYNQFKITEALLKYKIPNSQYPFTQHQIFQTDEFLKSNLLIYQPQTFLKYFSDQLLSTDHSKVYSFIQGVFVNLVLFENQHSQDLLHRYLEMNLVGFKEEQKERVQKNLFMKKATLEMCIKSLASGNGSILESVRKILNCPEKSNVKIIFQLGFKLMERAKKRSYNADVWNNIYKTFEKSQSITPSKKQIEEDEMKAFIKGCLQEISTEIPNLQFNSVKQTFQSTLLNTLKKGAKPYQCYLAALMSSFKIICDISEFREELTQIKAPQYEKIELYISKEQISKCDIDDGVLSVEVEVTTLDIYQMKILSLQFNKALRTSVHKFFIRNVSEDIVKMNNFSAEQNRYFPLKGHNFKFNLNTFKDIQQYEILQLLLQKKGEQELLLSFEQLEDLSTPSKQFTIYSLLDVYGPINLNEENISSLALQSISFYKYEPIPNHKDPIFVQYRKNLPNITKQNELIKKDINNYFTFFKQQVQKQHKSNLQFSNTILISVVSKGKDKLKDHIQVQMCTWSLRNILRCIGVTHSYSNDLKLRFDSTFDIQISPKSLIETLQALQLKSQQLLFKQMSEFLFHSRHQKIVESLLLMIVEDAFNVMKVVKGIIFVHKVTNKKSKNLFKLGQTFSVSNFTYQIKDQLFTITMEICKNSPNEVKQLQVYQCPELVSRKQFLDSIFENTDFLTDYFLNKTAINQQCVRISTNLSKKINSHINISVDYKSLYTFVEQLRKNSTIRQIDTMITSINTHILHNFQSTMDNYLNSQQVALKYQVKLFNKFYALKNHKPINQIESAQILLYQTYNHNVNGITRVNIQIPPEKISMIKNMFLLQVYKSHFSSMVTQGMTFLFGYKNNKAPNVLKLANRNDINQINIVDIAFILLVTNSLPTEDELKREKIIRLFVADLNGFIYNIQDSVTNMLLNEKNEQRSISELIPLIAPNILLHFPSQYLKREQIQVDSPLVKIIEIPVGRQSKIKMKPQKAAPISTASELKINTLLIDNIENILYKLEKYFDKKIQFLIVPSDQVQNVALVDMAKLVLYDFQYLIDHYMSKLSFCNILQLRLSTNSPNHNILDNFFRKRRKELFQKYFSKIRVQLGAKQGGVSIQNETLIIRAKFNKNGQIISANAIECYILEYLIKMEKPEEVKIVRYEQLSKQILIKFLDSISLLGNQKQEIKLAYKIAEKLSVALPQSYCIYIGQQDKKDIRLKDNILQLNFKSSNDIRQFYSASRILSVILNKNPDLIQAIEKINYLPHQNQIEVSNLQDEEVKIIFIESNNNIHLIDQELKTKISNKTLTISAPSFAFKEFYAFTSYAVVWNTFYKFDESQKIAKGKNTNAYLNEEVIYQLKCNSNVNLNACPIVLNVKRPSHISKNQNFVINAIEGYEGLRMKLLSQNVCIVGLKMPFTCNATLQYPTFTNYNHENDSASIHFISKNDIAIEKTKFIELCCRGKTIPAKKHKERDEDSQQKAFIEPPQFKKIDEKQVKQKDIESLVYIVNDESRKFLTRAGDERIDYIQLCDIDGNPVQNKQIKVYFEHINNLCVIKPEIQVKGSMLGLKWKPTIRGHYQVFINDICMNPQYQIGVSAAIADPPKSRVQPPKVKEICFAEQTQCTFTLRDEYENIYTELEQTIIGDSLIIEMQAQQEVKKYLKMKLNPIDKYGIKKVRFSIDNPKGDNGGISIIKVLMNKMQMISFQLKINGQALKQRKKNLDSDINALNKHFHKEIVVSRSKFMENLIQTAKKSLHVTFSVKFQGQQGIDAGGLKRQFYDMLGNQYKSERNGFFKPTDITKSDYFLNPDILKNKISNEIYMELLGKYLANAILNGYLIGVNFSEVFIKMLYQDKIQFEDLLRILSAQQAARYRYLLSAKPQEFQDLQLYFSIALDKKKGVQVDLIEDGRNIPVTAENVQKYLQLLSEALLTKRFKQSVDNFRNGFNTVIDIAVIRRWIRPNQFWCLTAGTKEITPQIVLQYINFSGGSEMHNGWFRRYISEANQQILIGFLKFSSGSGSIDFNQTSKVTVTFQNAGANPKKLPISHTCWKQIVVPKYKSYEVMHKLLNAAFLFCSEGFGFG